MASASAKHILVKDRELCLELKEKIHTGETTFDDVAQKYSECPSGAANGNLGTFSRGQMVAEFDQIVFSQELDVIHGPVRTQFGFHLIKITGRE